jgi:hypothetical protein
LTTESLTEDFFPGLYWLQVECRFEHGVVKRLPQPDSYIRDFVTHDSDFLYNHFGIHVGQDDRLTFFGKSSRIITGEFIDCRKGSPTLHKRVTCKFSPNPNLCLVIERGIAHTFDGLGDILTLDEPIWFISESNPDFNMGNDVVNFSRTINEKYWPIVEINQLPIPSACYAYITARQHETLATMTSLHYPYRVKTLIDNEERYLSITRL